MPKGTVLKVTEGFTAAHPREGGAGKVRPAHRLCADPAGHRFRGEGQRGHLAAGEGPGARLLDPSGPPSSYRVSGSSGRERSLAVSIY